jgi:hypothetical protein
MGWERSGRREAAPESGRRAESQAQGGRKRGGEKYFYKKLIN